ncbi:MAG: sugar transferase [Cyanobacteria bacterium J06554_3]
MFTAHLHTQDRHTQDRHTQNRKTAPSALKAPSFTKGIRQQQQQVASTLQTIRWHRSLPAANSWSKRCLDIVGAIAGLGLVAIVLFPIAIAMQIDSPGPLFFGQIRYGYKGKPFRIWKFRSMIPQAEAYKHTVKNQAQGFIFKNEADPRITRIGRFLRRTSLDELPQFWNVLKGDMSLVGTRPPVLNEVVRYQPHHWQRLAVKPGITGKWQTSGRSSIKDFEQIVAMDLDYQRQWSILTDIKILFKTVSVVLCGKDAC